MRHHGFYLRVIRYVAADRQGLVALARQFLGRSLYGFLMPVSQDHCRPRFSKGFSRGKAESGCGTGNERNLIFERNIHVRSFLVMGDLA
jgi:hypothetical protein